MTRIRRKTKPTGRVLSQKSAKLVKPSRGASLPQQAKGVGFAVGRSRKAATPPTGTGRAPGRASGMKPAAGFTSGRPTSPAPGFGDLKPGGIASGLTARSGRPSPAGGGGAFGGLKPGGIPIGGTPRMGGNNAIPRSTGVRKTATGTTPRKR